MPSSEMGSYPLIAADAEHGLGPLLSLRRACHQVRTSCPRPLQVRYVPPGDRVLNDCHCCNGIPAGRAPEPTRGRFTAGGVLEDTCQGTVPTALICALESTSLEDAVRNAVSLGRDPDTLAAIAGAVGEAMHGVRDELVQTARERYLNDARDITAMHSDSSVVAIRHNEVKLARSTCRVSEI